MTDRISVNNAFDFPIQKLEKVEDRPIGLVVNEPIEPELLETHCLMYRLAPAGAHEVLFTDTDPVTGEEIWDASGLALGQGIDRQISQADKWRALMEWPPGSRDPTPADALAFMAWADACAGAALFHTLEAERSKLAAARERDAAERAERLAQAKRAKGR
jgi:hypothetical protein